MGGSSKKQTVGYWYALTTHMGICYGPVDSVDQFLVDDRIAWSGSQTTSGSVSVDQPNLFGGEEREGGLVGQLDICMGEPTQARNAKLSSLLGNSIPAFRGILGLVWDGKVAANNPYLKAWAVRVSRFLQGWDGGTVWYSAKAKIARPAAMTNFPAPADSVWSYKIVDPLSPTYAWDAKAARAYHRLDYNHSAWPTGDGPFGSVERYPSVGTAIGRGDGYTVWLRKEFVTGEAINVGPLTFSVSSDDGYTLYWNGEAIGAGVMGGADTHTYTIPASKVRNRNIVALKVVDCHPSGTPNILASLSVTSAGSTYDMNPAHIVYQCLTDPVWGMGYPTSSIDDTNFRAVADTLYSEGFGLSMIWNQQSKIENFVQIIMDHIGGVLSVDPTTGKFRIKLIRGDYVVGDLPVIDPSNAVLDDFQRVAVGETINEVTVVYTNPDTGDDATLTVQNLANIQEQGATINRRQSYAGINSSALAARVAMRDLIAQSTPLSKIKLSVNRQAWQLMPGDPFVLNWPKMGVTSAVYRVLQMNQGTLKSGTITIDACEDVFGLPASVYVDQQPGAWEEGGSEPSPSINERLLETPYWDLARSLTAADLAYVDPLDGYLQVISQAPSSDALDFQLWSRPSGGEYANTDNGSHCATAILVGNIGLTDETLTYEDEVDIDIVVAGGYIIIDDEYIFLNAIDTAAKTISVKRGALDTVPAAHADGALIWFASGFQAADPTAYVSGETVQAKVVTATGRGVLDIDDAFENSLVMAQRQYRPYPPGKIQLNGSAYPTYISGALTVSWAHRDRLQQTTAVIVDQATGNIGPEAGTTYTVELYNELGALVRTVTGLTGTTYTWSTEESDSLIGEALYSRTWDDLSVSDQTIFGTVTPSQSASTGKLVVSSGGSSADAHLRLDAGPVVADFDASFDFVIDSSTSTAPGFIYRTTSWVNANDSFGYLVYLRGGSIALGRGTNSTSGGFTAITGLVSHGVAAGDTARIRVRVVGSSHKVWVNGTLLINATNSTFSAAGYMGFRHYGPGSSTYDNLVVSDTASVRLNRHVRAKIKSVRDGVSSWQTHDVETDRAGYGLNYGLYYGAGS